MVRLPEALVTTPNRLLDKSALAGLFQVFKLNRSYISQRKSRWARSRKAKLDFRWEMYDLFNLKTWNNPASADLSNSLFGVVTNASGNRTMQGGLKLVF